MIVTSRRDRNSGYAKVAGTSRSPLLRLPMRSEFLRPSKNQELLAPAAPDCAWFKSIEQDLRRRARLEAECLAEFNQPAALSTYQRGKSVRTTRATALHPPRASSKYALCAFCLLLASGIALTNATHRSHRLIFITHESGHVEQELKWTTLKAL